MKRLAMYFVAVASAITVGAQIGLTQTFHWEVQQLPEADLMIQVKALNPSVAWALGIHGSVFRTADGGKTWSSVGSGLVHAGGITTCIDAISATTAFVGGLNYDAIASDPPSNDTTFIWRTTDGGLTWSEVFAQPHGFLNAVKMISATEGIGVGDPVDGKFTVIRTTDSGATWSRTVTEPSQMHGEFGLFRSLCTYGTTHLWFGTSVGTNSSAAVYRSTNAGSTWSRVSTPFEYDVYSVSFSDSLHGVCGESSLARSRDGGVTWSPISLPGGHYYPEIFPTVAVFCGKDFWAAVDTIVYRSTDFGVSWDSVYSNAHDTLTYASVAMVGDSTTGWFTSMGANIVAFKTVTGVHEMATGNVPTGFALEQNYPNPFNPTTVISYQLPAFSEVRLVVHDLLGREVGALVNERKSPGTYDVKFSASGLASGVYFYRLTAGNRVLTRKMVMMK